MKRIKISLIYIFSIITVGCTPLVTGFSALETNKESQARERFGDGNYYRFSANGSDLGELDVVGVDAIEILVHQNENKPEECVHLYEVITQTYVFSKGGSASIFVRCN